MIVCSREEPTFTTTSHCFLFIFNSYFRVGQSHWDPREQINKIYLRFTLNDLTSDLLSSKGNWFFFWNNVIPSVHWERLQRIPANPSLWLSCTWPSSIMSDNRPIVPCCTLLLVITDRHTLSTLVVPHQPLNKRQLAVAKTIHRLTDWPTELPNPTNRNNLCDKGECLHQCYRCRRRWHSLPCRTQANLDKWMVVPDQPNKDRYRRVYCVH